jgi:hypothetical protein
MVFSVADLLGPGAAFVLSLIMLALFYTGKILPRNTVPREDYDELVGINASYIEKFGLLIDAVKALSASVDRIARNGSGGKI